MPKFYSSRRRLGLAALGLGYVSHVAASLLLPKLAFISIICWLIALGGGAVYCTETMRRVRRGPAH